MSNSHYNEHIVNDDQSCCDILEHSVKECRARETLFVNDGMGEIDETRTHEECQSPVMRKSKLAQIHTSEREKCSPGWERGEEAGDGGGKMGTSKAFRKLGWYHVLNQTKRNTLGRVRGGEV